jgi:HEAT repeat protein/DNA polymerase III delta prime subunit
MSDIFQFLDLDQVSFWIGFFSGLLFFWVLVRVRPILSDVVEYSKLKFVSWREGITTSTEERFRADLLKYVQKRHIAAPLCSLDEILVTPQVYFPPPITVGDEAILDLEIVEEILPFLPDWPELPAAFNFPAHPISMALRGEASLLLLGPPGIGKTTALCHLASQFARRESALGLLANHLPLFIDAKELLMLNPAPTTILEQVIAIVSRYASTLTLTRLSTVVRGSLISGKAVLILDSIDELSQSQVNQITTWLANFITHFPNIIMVVAASPIYHASLLTFSLQPIGLAAWSKKEERIFFEKWAGIWNEIVFAQPLNPYSNVPSPIIESWINNFSPLSTPFESVLRVWSTLAGDSLGPGGLAAIEAHIRRMTHDLPKAPQILSDIAGSMVMQGSPVIKRSSIKGVQADINPEPQPVTLAPGEHPESEKKQTKVSVSSQTVDTLIQNGILCEVGGDGITFSNPWFPAYISSNRYFDPDELSRLWNQPNSEFRSLILGLISSHQDFSPHILPHLEQGEDPTFKTTLEYSRWLRFADPEFAWKNKLLTTLASKLQESVIPFSLRCRTMAALVSTKDSSAEILFRRLMSHYQPAIRITGCLGAGLARDQKAITDLKSMLTDQNPGVQKAACIGLGAMRDPSAIEAVAYALVHGDEGLQQCAAEVLAGDPLEGYDTLREGSTYDQLLVRRAVVRGLRKIREPWSDEILTKIQIDDSQWVVRNAAEQAIRFLEGDHPGTPMKFPALQNTPWLIEYASQHGVGISGQLAAEEMLIDAAGSGNENQKQLAFYLLIFMKEIKAGAAMQLYHGVFGDSDPLKEAAYTSLWMLGGRGISLPKPVEFGFGYE